MSRLAAVQRVDHGLDHGGGSVVGAGIGPVLEKMRSVDMPFRNHRGFIEVGTEMGSMLHAAHGLVKMQVHRRAVYRVGIQDHQPVDLTGLHVVHQADDVLPLDGRHRIDGLGVNHRFADVAQSLIDGDRGQMHFR